MAATGASMMQRMAVGPVGPRILWAGFGLGTIIATPALLMPETVTKLLQPLRVFHQEWVDARIEKLTVRADAIQGNAGGARDVLLGCDRRAGLLVLFYVAIARSMSIPVGFAELAVIVPVSFIVQMIPLSVNGFGVREATFGFYFTRLGLAARRRAGRLVRRRRADRAVLAVWRAVAARRRA